jgi:hypothetical protein
MMRNRRLGKEERGRKERRKNEPWSKRKTGR